MILLLALACRTKDLPRDTGTLDTDPCPEGGELADWFIDGDGDGYGSEETVQACSQPSGSSSVSGDCDDDEPEAYPTNVEVCDGIDNNCDGQTDEGVTESFYPDGDGDGFGLGQAEEFCEQPSGYADNDEDCDDDAAAVNPDATETCNGLDDDCDGDRDEDDAADATTWSIDVDGDKFGSTDYQLTQCEQPEGYVEDDTDCDDTDSAVNTDGTELCDGIDNDCDGTADNDDAEDASTWYADSDTDGYGDSSSSTTACDQPSGYVTDNTDCDDTDGDVYPTAPELPEDGTDQNCDGSDGCHDLNCDSTADLLIPVYYDGAYGADSLIFYGSATGFSDNDSQDLAANSARRALAHDVDTDGYMDVLVVNYRSTTSYNVDSTLYYGSATGFSSSNSDALPAHGPYYALAEDLDGDGYNDIVLANYNGGSTADSYIYWGTVSGFVSSNSTSLSNNGAIEARASDLDGDGYTDLVFCNHYGGSYSVNSHVYYGAATGFSSTNREDVPTYGCYDLAIEDFNADGYEDIVFANYQGSYAYLYWGTSSGFSTSYIDYLPTSGSLGVQTEDFDLDGYIDIALGGYDGPTRVYWNSSVGFSNSVYDAIASSGTRGLQSADLDSDGYPDLVLPTYYNGGYSTNSYVYWGTTTGFDDSNRSVLPTIGATQVGVGDLDADGYPELVFSGYYNGSWASSAPTYIYWGSSTGYDSSARTDLETWGSYGTPQLVGDTDW